VALILGLARRPGPGDKKTARFSQARRIVTRYLSYYCHEYAVIYIPARTRKTDSYHFGSDRLLGLLCRS